MLNQRTGAGFSRCADWNSWSATLNLRATNAFLAAATWPFASASVESPPGGSAPSREANSAIVASDCTRHLQSQYTSLSSSGLAAAGSSVTPSVPLALGVKLRLVDLNPGLLNRSLIGL